MVSQDFRRQLEGYGLTTANILYRRPDHPWLLQTYVWQDYDLCPMFPQLNKFLNFWLEKLEGPLPSVTGALPSEGSVLTGGEEVYFEPPLPPPPRSRGREGRGIAREKDARAVVTPG